jgi:hypothetical protein
MVPFHPYTYYCGRTIRYFGEQGKIEELIMECGCGRSPTGKCIGWHALSEEEYQNELDKFQAEEAKKDVSENED